MAVPELDERGFLPSGVHAGTLDELDRRFAGISGGVHRRELFRRLEAFMEEARSSHLVRAVIVDGSFVTGSERPNDVDLILVLQRGHDFAAEIRPFQYNVLSRRRVRRRYGFDILVAPDGTVLLEEYTTFFQQVRNEPDTTKGIVRVEL